MLVRRELWRDRFPEGSFPSWPCPRRCGGIVRVVSGSARKEETKESREAHAHDEWEPDWIEELYDCRLRCAQCRAVVVLAGLTSNRYEQWFERHSQQVVHEVETDVHPHWFLPAVPLIEIPDGVPESVAAPLEEAFSLYWASPSSCAARIRAALEHWRR